MMKHQKEEREQAADAQQNHLTPAEKAEIKVGGAVVPEETTPSPGLMRIDLHCHSQASHDCDTLLSSFPLRCQESNILVQAITDHNEIWGAQQLKQMVANEFGSVNLSIIIGEEISTSHGELIGLFLQEKIAAGLSPEATVAHIKDQGGLVLLPHGFDPLKRYRLQPEARERIRADIDIVETFNARVSRPKWNRAAVDWAKVHHKLFSAGSDSHTFTDIGTAWVEAPRQKIETPQELIAVLAEGGVPVGEWTHPILAFLYKTSVQLTNRIKWRFT